MSLESVLLTNGLSKLIVAALALLVTIKMGKESRCILRKPFFFLALLLFAASLLDFMWSAGAVSVSLADNMVLAPLIHLAIMGVWFYVSIVLSGERRIYYLIPIFIMSINALLLFKDLAVVCDVITGAMLIGVFFYMGIFSHHLIKKMSYLGMAYGAMIAGISLLVHFKGFTYVYAPWFLTDLLLMAILLLMETKVHVCGHAREPIKHHIPVVFEIFRFGLFIVGLSVFLMLGTLGVHELGHSLAANAFGCAHDTEFEGGYAVTHVACASGGGSMIITLGGLILTVAVSFLMFFMGNDFARRISFLLLAFSMLISVDDLAKLGLAYSWMVVGVFASAVLIGYGIMLVVQEYELEYSEHEAGVCVSHCEGVAAALK